MGDIVNHSRNQNETKLPMTFEIPLRRVQRVRHEIKKRELQVLRVDTLGPHFRSVTLAGEA